MFCTDVTELPGRLKVWRAVPEVIVDVEDVGQEALGRPLFELQLAQLQGLPTVRDVVTSGVGAGP